MIKLSVVIICLNEERNIARCLNSVEGIADEIIVLDSGSTDNTKTICENAGVRFFTHEFIGHIEQKNHALSLAEFPYILSLDADEALSDELRLSIMETKKNWHADGYTMNRLANYCGSWIRHGSWYPDVKLRLFHREKGAWGGSNPHDKLILNPNTTAEHLSGDLLHYTYYSEEEHRERTFKYANISAQALLNRGQKALFFQPYIMSAARFLKEYILRLGLLDAKNGWIISKTTAWGTFQKYKILIHLHHQKKQV